MKGNSIPNQNSRRKEKKTTLQAKFQDQTECQQIEDKPTISSISSLQMKGISYLNKNLETEKNPKKQGFQKIITSKIKFPSDSFGPKPNSFLLASKESSNEDIPLDSENSNIFNKIKKLKQNGENFSLSELGSEESKNESSKEEYDSLKSFYNTNPSHLAKEEDEFWRYERDEEILNKHYKNVFGFVIEEKVGK